MPSMDGFEFVRRLRADPKVGGTAVIFHTAPLTSARRSTWQEIVRSLAW